MCLAGKLHRRKKNIKKNIMSSTAVDTNHKLIKNPVLQLHEFVVKHEDFHIQHVMWYY